MSSNPYSDTIVILKNIRNYVDGRKSRAIVIIKQQPGLSKKPVGSFSFYFSLVSPLGEKGAGNPKST
jgi:hypothetical protein